MHLKSKQVAWCGIIMAIAVILQVSAGIIETSSFFLLAAASFLAGCVQRKFGLKISIAFSIGAFILGIILAPQKLYCFTFAGFCVYVLLAEYFRKKRHSYMDNDKIIKMSTEYIIKGVIYHIILAAALFISFNITGLDIIFSKELLQRIKGMSLPVMIIAAILLAEALWLIFDKAYIFFQERYGYIVCGRDE